MNKTKQKRKERKIRMRKTRKRRKKHRSQFNKRGGGERLPAELRSGIRDMITNDDGNLEFNEEPPPPPPPPSGKPLELVDSLNEYQDLYEDFLYEFKKEEYELNGHTNNLTDKFVEIINKNNDKILQKMMTINTKKKQIEGYNRYLLKDSFKRGSFKKWIKDVYVKDTLATFQSPMAFLNASFGPLIQALGYTFIGSFGFLSAISFGWHDSTSHAGEQGAGYLLSVGQQSSYLSYT